MSDLIGLHVEEISDLIKARDILSKHSGALVADKAHTALVAVLKKTYLQTETP